MFNVLGNLFKQKENLSSLINKGAVVIDVRTSSEFQAGNIKGSRNIPLDQLRKEINLLKEMNKPVITVCRTGNRSGMAKSILVAAGVEAYNGGAWMNLKSKIQ